MARSRDEVIQSVLAAHNARSHTENVEYVGGQWMVRSNGVLLPFGGARNLDSAVDIQIQMEAAQEHDALATLEEARQRAAASMAGPGGQNYRVDARTGDLYGGYAEYSAGQRKWSTWARASDREQSEFQARTDAERQFLSAGPAEDAENRDPAAQEEAQAQARRRGGWGGLGRNSFAQAALAGVVGAGIAGLQGALMPVNTAANMAASPFGGTGAAAVGIGQGLTDMVVHGIRTMGNAGAAALGAAFALALPGPIGIGIGIAVGAIAGEVANSFGIVGRTIAETLGNVGKAMHDLISVGRQLSNEIMGVAYRTGQGPRAGAQMVGLEQAFGLPQGSMAQMFGGWQQRPEFLLPRLQGFGINAGDGRGGVDYASMLTQMRGQYQSNSPMMRLPMLRAMLGGDPSTEMLAMMNMPSANFNQAMGNAGGFQRNAGTFAGMQERISPLLSTISMQGQAMRMDMLTAIMPLLEQALTGIVNLFNRVRPQLQEWLQERLPHYLSIIGRGLIDFAENLIKSWPSIVGFLKGLVESFASAYNWIRGVVPGLPALPAWGGSSAGVAGSAAARAGGGAAGGAVDQNLSPTQRALRFGLEHPLLAAGGLWLGSKALGGAGQAAGRGLWGGLSRLVKGRGAAGAAAEGTEAAQSSSWAYRMGRMWGTRGGLRGLSLGSRMAVPTGAAGWAGSLLGGAGLGGIAGMGGAMGMEAMGMPGGWGAAGMGFGTAAAGAGLGFMRGGPVGAIAGAGAAVLTSLYTMNAETQRIKAQAESDFTKAREATANTNIVTARDVARRRGVEAEWEEGSLSKGEMNDIAARAQADNRASGAKAGLRAGTETRSWLLEQMEKARAALDEDKLRTAIKAGFLDAQNEAPPQPITMGFQVDGNELARTMEPVIAMQQMRGIMLKVA